MKLGIIVLPNDNAELADIIAKLQGTGATIETTTSGTVIDTPDDDGLDFGSEPETEALFEPNADELKTILTQVRDEVSVDMLKEILTSFGATNLKTLEKSDWPSAYASAKAALGGSDAGGDDDFGFDDDELGGDEAPDAETVKTGAQAYAKKHGKEKAIEALKKAGLNSVRGIKGATGEQLAKLWSLVGS